MATDKRKIQEINAGSMADIAFLLLIFFLVATTMNTDTGLVRMLPPMPPEDQNLPEKANKDIELPDGGKWVYPVSEGVVSLQTTRDTGYQSYIMVQNELTRAFNEVRDEVAQRKFGAKFADLPEELRNAVSKAVPLKISEAEPRNIKK